VTAHPEAAYVAAVDWPERGPDVHPETLAWAARIEALRLEIAGVLCPTCESTATPITRRCYRCEEVKALTAFDRERGESLGHGYLCKACKRERSRAQYAERKRAAFRAVLGRSA